MSCQRNDRADAPTCQMDAAGAVFLRLGYSGTQGGSSVVNTRAGPCYEGTIRSVRIDSACVASQRRWILVVTILGSTIAYVDESIVDVALPAIQADLKVSVSVIQWIINAYML